MRKFLGLTGMAILMLACNLATSTQAATQPPSSGMVSPQPVQGASPAAPTQADSIAATATTSADLGIPDGETVSVGGISFLIPNGMASDATAATTTDVELPYINPSNGNMPQHVKFTLNNYAAQGTELQPQIIVFKADDLAQYSDLTASMVTDLRNLQYTDGQPVPQSLASTTFMAQIHGINFQNGRGIRYLDQIQQAPLPINNQAMFYYFQGITNDGQYYVEVSLPTQVPFLAADDNLNTPLPANGIPFNLDDLPGYYNAVTQQLNTTDTFAFTPYLDHLDSLIASLQITGLQ